MLLINPNIYIYIIEFDSIGRGFAKDKFAFQKYTELIESYPNIELYDLSHSPVSIYDIKGAYFKEGIILSSLFRDVDFLISMSKMKTHTNTVITGCMKNLFGCLPEMDKDKYHPYLPDVIADINKVIKPDLCILDACPAMEGRGPIFGKPKDLGIVLYGIDPVAVDSTSARIMGFQPENIPMLKTAAHAGIGLLNSNEIKINGIMIEEVYDRFSFISWENRGYVQFGFALQRIAGSINKLGHLIHSVPGTWWALKKTYTKIIKRTKY